MEDQSNNSLTANDMHMLYLLEQLIKDKILNLVYKDDITQMTNWAIIQQLNIFQLKLIKFPSQISSLTNNQIKVLIAEECNINFKDFKMYNIQDLQLIKCSGTVDDLSQFHKLSNFTYSKNYKDIQFLQNMKQLVQLDISENYIQNIKMLGDLVNLEELNLSKNLCGDITPLKKLTKLIKLDLCSQQYIKYSDRVNILTNIQTLKYLINLKELDISQNSIAEISPLKCLKSLSKLILRANNVYDLSPLKLLINLCKLDIAENCWVDLSPLKYLVNLNYLSISRCVLKTKLKSSLDISSLQYLTQLSSLFMQQSQVFDISVLRPLTNLKEIAIDGNKITDLRPLENAKQLKYISLNDNYIQDLSAISFYRNIQYIKLQYQLKPTQGQLNQSKRTHLIYITTTCLRQIGKWRQSTKQIIASVKYNANSNIQTILNNHIQCITLVGALFSSMYISDGQ
ncbi:leucine-rich_repeat domain-containing protein [Hexamita inflata]|uniref:Leucine-rich repeat domain-containing protein n=1 Tax=Hexamita inflata TaxID=28002 RepID=A0AA86V1T3_9EUKA|nr:leucine-rich repeat domain-containing protein [Hexamita inflata]